MRRVFSVDLRALAVFRIALGLLLIIDVLSRAPDLAAHYTNFGVAPQGPYTEHFLNPDFISLHLASGTLGWQALLFVLTLLAGIAVTLGFRTRWATALAWVLVVSMQNRNVMVLNGGDVLLRLLWFWAMFLPLGRRYSLDRALAESARLEDKGNPQNREFPEDPSFFSASSLAFTLQIAALYAATAALKSGPEWFPDGTASYYALQLDQFTTAFGKWMSQWYGLLKVSTFLVYGLEVMTGLLLLCPWYFARVRVALVLLLILMHMSFDSAMRLGIFPWVDMVALIPLLPREFWDYWTRVFARADRFDLKIYYDGGCGFCKKMVLIIRECLFLNGVSVISSQASPSVQAQMDRENSWIVQDGSGRTHLRFEALVTVIEHASLIGAFAERLPLRILTPLGDKIYNRIAASRKSLGKVTSVWLPNRPLPPLNPPFTAQMLSLFFITLILWINLASIPALNIKINPPWNTFAAVLRIDQVWNMFAPFPFKDDGWFIIDGELVSGTHVSLTDRSEALEGPVRFDKPELVSDQHPNARWRKYMMNITSTKRQRHRLYFGKYLCRQWNRHHHGEEQLKGFDLIFMRERTPPYGQPFHVEKLALWKHQCLAGQAPEKPSQP